MQSLTQSQRRRPQMGDFLGYAPGYLFVAIAALAMALPQAATAGSSPVPVPPPTPTPTPGPGRVRPSGPQIDPNQTQSLILPASEELQPLTTNLVATPAVTGVPTTTVPVSVPLSSRALGNLRAGSI
ncbi:MAG: hypothetical protein HC918_02380 [Oscillatoriales cyanobacterium SM2_1_8]|nr:hypothetical protein [Oscillatoriales cyanobacterium SM2_1_8]